MAKDSTTKPDGNVLDYRHERAKRKNNPPTGLAAQGRIAERPADHYAYNPQLPPVLRFDGTDRLVRIRFDRHFNNRWLAKLRIGL
jgi:hypothetical protein